MNKYSIFDCSEIVVPAICDERGNLAVIQEEVIPFEIKRVFFIYEVPQDKQRGGHAHKEQTTILFALNGSFEVVLDDGMQKRTVVLQDPTKGLLLQPGVWSVLQNFQTGTVCLSINSDIYQESDYIRDYDLFLEQVALIQEC